MKNKTLKIAIILILFTFFGPVKIFSQVFSIDGELRPRFEFKNGYKKFADSTTTPGYVVSQRTRLSLKYVTKNLTTKITIQDTRIWGDDPLKTDVAGLFLYEGWAELGLCKNLSIKIGRQEINYDNERLLSKINWNIKGMTHDAAVIKFKTDTWNIDLGSAYNQTTDANNFGTDYSGGAGNYKTLNYLWISKSIKDFGFSALGIADGYQKRATSNTLYVRGTFGPILTYKTKDINIGLRGFYQMGKDTAGSTINSHYASADFSYTFFKKLTTSIGGEYISGNDAKDTLNKDVNCFSTLYGSGHAFNGNMDFFTDMPKNLKKAGLVDLYLNLNYKFNDKASIRLDYHYFMLQNNYAYKNEVINKNLCSEFDLSGKLNFSKEIALTLGYSVALGQKSMGIIVGGDYKSLANWGWLCLTVTPNFFTSAEKK